MEPGRHGYIPTPRICLSARFSFCSRAGQAFTGMLVPMTFSTLSNILAHVTVNDSRQRSGRTKTKHCVFTQGPSLGRCHCGHIRIGSSRRKLDAFLAAQREHGFMTAKNTHKVYRMMPNDSCELRPMDGSLTES
jgi:hypothetical protein